MRPAPLQMVKDVEVLDLTGPGAEVFNVGGAEVAVGPSGTVVIVDAVDDPAASGVRNRREFALVGPVGQGDADRLVRHGSAARPIHLFVRLQDGALYLGTGRHGQSSWTHDPDVLLECVLWLDAPLSREALDRVRPPSTPASLPGLEWLDRVETDRATALRLFVEGWHPVSGPDPELAASSVRVPVALAEFYRLAQGRTHVLGVQNFIRPAARLSTDAQGLLEFGHENQGGFEWVLDPSEDDPIVWTMDDCEEQPHAEHERLSGFLIQFSLHEAAMSAPYSAWSRSVPTPLAREVTGTLRRVPLKPWMPAHSTTSFHVAPGLVTFVHDYEDGECLLRFGAVHRGLLRPLADIGIEWACFDG